MSKGKTVKVLCLKSSTGNKGIGVHNPGTAHEWTQTFSKGKEYALPEKMAKTLISDGIMKEIKGGGNYGKD